MAERDYGGTARRLAPASNSQASELPDPLPYSFDSDGWTWFTVIDNSQLAVGADKYVAVNMETGEAKYFAALGE